MRGAFLIVVALFVAAPTFAQYPELQINVEKEWSGKTYEYSGGPGQDPENYMTWPIVDTTYEVVQVPVTTEPYPGCMFDPELEPELCAEDYINWTDAIIAPHRVCSHDGCTAQMEAKCQAKSDQRWLGGGSGSTRPYATCGSGALYGRQYDFVVTCSCSCIGDQFFDRPEVVVTSGCVMGLYY
jgi:Rieske Fe-S protein